MNKAILFGGAADGLERVILGPVNPIAIAYFDGSVLYYAPEFTDAGKLATDSEGRVIYRFRGSDRPPEVANAP